MTATIRIEFDSRWDALALTRSLGRQRWYLVEPDPVHWDVCVDVERGERRDAGDLRRSIEAWLQQRRIPALVTDDPAA